MKKLTLKQLLPVLIILFGIAVFALLKLSQPSSVPTAIKERIWHVKSLIANPQSYSPTLSLYGQIESPALVSATAPNKSQVTAVYVREGDAIKKGQLLLSLDERDFKPYLDQASARVSELKALILSEQSRHKADKKSISHERHILNLEYSAVKRATLLKEKKLGSTATLEQAQEELNRQQLSFTNRKLALEDHSARLQQLNARLSHAEADVQLTQLDLERSQIIASFDGFIEKLSVSLGDQVKENQVLLSFYSTEQLEIRAKIPSSFQNEIQKALFIQQTLSASADYAGTPLQLTLNRLSGMADSRGVDALFSIDSGNEWVRPGSSISLSLQRPNKENVIVLPYSALYDNNRIYRIVNHRLELVLVQTVGNYIENNTEKLLVFSEQLQQGDEILITHLPNAINGLKVLTSIQ
ncbi:MAG: biotin/lipoyl-binding protein [Methylococcales bacterium]|nr:biotin/lipoyl-binding protein [Methylococcales bacterium]